MLYAALVVGLVLAVVAALAGLGAVFGWALKTRVLRRVNPLGVVAAHSRTTTRTHYLAPDGHITLIEWRIRRARAEELAVAQHVGMAVLSREQLARELKPDDRDELEEADQLARQARRSDPEEVRRVRQADARLVCLCVEALRVLDPISGEPLSEWLPIRLSQDEPTDREAGVMSIDDLPPSAEQTLALDVAAWLLGGQAALHTLTSFRAGVHARAGAPRGPAPPREDLRDPTLDAAPPGRG